MRTLRQLSYIGTTTLLTSIAVLAGCSSADDDSGSGNNGPGQNGPGQNGTGGGSTGPGGGGDTKVCVPGVPTTSQIPRLLNREYDAVVYDLLGVETLPSANNQRPSSLLNADFEGPMNTYAWNAYLDAAEKIAAEVFAGPGKSRFIDCDPAVAGCLTDTIRTFGRKAFRRPLTAEDVARFEALGRTTPPGTPEEVAQTTLVAFLVSPSFLMLPELAETTPSAEDGAPAGAFKLSSHEVAARLSFSLWGSVPDEELDAASDADQLTTREQIFAQAERMITERAKTGPLVSEFHRFYLGMDASNSHWWKAQHDTSLYPAYTVDAVPAMQAELDAFFEEVTFGGGKFSDLFLSNVGFVNNQTAALYGLDAASYGPELTRVDLDPNTRPGFLTRLGFLSSFASFAATSPILRGAFITVNLVGVDPGPPSPAALQVPAPPGEYRTERAYVDALTGQDGCRNCHVKVINPPGFVLENYDAVGSWQTTDRRGDPIDPVATVTFSQDNVKEIRSAVELMQEIGRGPLARRIYAEKWVSFVNGRAPNQNDACTVNELDTKLSEDGYTVLALLADLTQADSFRLRTREN